MTSGLRHHGAGKAPTVGVTADQRVSASHLGRLDAPHDAFAAGDVGPESPSTGTLLGLRRRLLQTEHERDRFCRHFYLSRGRAAALRAQLEHCRGEREGAEDLVRELRTSVSCRITGPVRWSAARLERARRGRSGHR